MDYTCTLSQDIFDSDFAYKLDIYYFIKIQAMFIQKYKIFPHSLDISFFIYFSCTSFKDMRILLNIVQMYLINFVGHTSVLLYINVRMCKIKFLKNSTRAHEILEVKNIQNMFFC